jgi:hypothetical protein
MRKRSRKRGERVRAAAVNPEPMDLPKDPLGWDEINQYMTIAFHQFAFRDIEKCITSGANLSAALCLLCYTEHLGGLISGRLHDTDQSQENFNRGLTLFD